MMEEETLDVDVTEVSDGAVSLEKKVEWKEEGVVVTYTINSDVGQPVAVRVADPLPAEEDQIETGFHPSNRPHRWGLEEGVVSFEDIVPRDDNLTVVFGIVSRDGQASSLELTEPSIESAQPLDEDDESATGGHEAGAIFRNSSLTQVRTANSELSGVPSSPGAPSSQVETDSSFLDAADPVTGDAGFDGGIDVTGSGMDHLKEGDDKPATGLATPEPADAAVNRSEMVGGRTDASSTQADMPPHGYVSALLEELESGSVDKEELKAFREAIGVKPTKALEVRLDHIQSRLEKFGAYTDALEAFINEHGTMEIITEIEADVDELDDELDDVRAELADADAERKELRDEVSSVLSGVERLDSELDERFADVHGNIDELRESLDSQTEATRSHMDNLEQAVDATQRSIESRVDQIQADVVELTEMRSVFAKAFEPGDGADEDVADG